MAQCPAEQIDAFGALADLAKQFPMRCPPRRISVVTSGAEELCHPRVHRDYNRHVRSSAFADYMYTKREQQEAAFCIFDLRELLRTNRVHQVFHHTLDGECVQKSFRRTCALDPLQDFLFLALLVAILWLHACCDNYYDTIVFVSLCGQGKHRSMYFGKIFHLGLEILRLICDWDMQVTWHWESKDRVIASQGSQTFSASQHDRCKRSCLQSWHRVFSVNLQFVTMDLSDVLHMASRRDADGCFDVEKALTAMYVCPVGEPFMLLGRDEQAGISLSRFLGSRNLLPSWYYFVRQCLKPMWPEECTLCLCMANARAVQWKWNFQIASYFEPMISHFTSPSQQSVGRSMPKRSPWADEGVDDFEPSKALRGEAGASIRTVRATATSGSADAASGASFRTSVTGPQMSDVDTESPSEEHSEPTPTAADQLRAKGTVKDFLTTRPKSQAAPAARAVSLQSATGDLQTTAPGTPSTRGVSFRTAAEDIGSKAAPAGGGVAEEPGPKAMPLRSCLRPAATRGASFRTAAAKTSSKQLSFAIDVSDEENTHSVTEVHVGDDYFAVGVNVDEKVVLWAQWRKFNSDDIDTFALTTIKNASPQPRFVVVHEHCFEDLVTIANSLKQQDDFQAELDVLWQQLRKSGVPVAKEDVQNPLQEIEFLIFMHMVSILVDCSCPISFSLTARFVQLVGSTFRTEAQIDILELMSRYLYFLKISKRTVPAEFYAGPFGIFSVTNTMEKLNWWRTVDRAICMQDDEAFADEYLCLSATPSEDGFSNQLREMEHRIRRSDLCIPPSVPDLYHWVNNDALTLCDVCIATPRVLPVFRSSASDIEVSWGGNDGLTVNVTKENMIKDTHGMLLVRGCVLSDRWTLAHFLGQALLALQQALEIAKLSTPWWLSSSFSRGVSTRENMGSHTSFYMRTVQYQVLGSLLLTWLCKT
eukprot:Skav200442  [mRNA]  locus=scaffold1922:5648:8440:+ [translate_table: standard]